MGVVDLESARRSLRDADARNRADALRTLGAHGGPAAIDDILSIAADPDDFVRGTVFEALGRVGEEVRLGMIERGFTDRDARARAFAARACEDCGLREAAHLIVSLLDDEDPTVRSQAALTLGAWKSPTALPALERRIDSERDADVRGFLYYARLRLPEADAARTRLDAEEGWETRHSALRSFNHTGLSGAGEMIARWLRAPDAGLRQAAANTLSRVELPNTEIIFTCLEDELPGVRAAAISALEDHADERLLNAARATLSANAGDGGGFAGASIRYLGRHGDDSDVETLRRLSRGAPGGETDAARHALAFHEGTAEIPGLPEEAGRSSDVFTSRGEDRTRAAVMRIITSAPGEIGAAESLAILDRARRRGDRAAAAVVTALCASTAGPQRNGLIAEAESEGVRTWGELGRAMERGGLAWTGPTRGRLPSPLHAGGPVSPITLLLRLAESYAPRAPVLVGESLNTARVWRAVEIREDLLRPQDH